MFTLPWIILGSLLVIVVVMSALSWTPVPHWLTKKFLMFTHKDKRENLNGRTVGYWIHLYPYNDDYPKAAINHELVHITQNWRYTWLVVALLRAVSSKMVLRFEAQAFAASEKTGRPLSYCAETLANEYGIDKLSVEQAKKEIKKYI